MKQGSSPGLKLQDELSVHDEVESQELGQQVSVSREPTGPEDRLRRKTKCVLRQGANPEGNQGCWGWEVVPSNKQMATNLKSFHFPRARGV